MDEQGLTRVDSAELLARLKDLHAHAGSAVVAFDGDGTLWSGDVGEDVFHRAVTERWLRTDALPALASLAETHGVSRDGDANDVARHIFEAYVAGTFPEREACEVLTWCYAGFELHELETRCREALETAKIGSRLQRELEPALEYCRSAGLRCIVVSASPRVAVEQAASLWGFSSNDIAAATPRLSAGRIAPGMDGVTPYALGKVQAARKLIGQAPWLASFGDNVFDIEMFQAARIGVAVRPKNTLRSRLRELENVVLFEDGAG